jgi:hypothetical protein
LQNILRKTISETPGASAVLNPDGTFKSTTPAEAALPNKANSQSSGVTTRKRSREAESMTQLNPPKKAKVAYKIANFRYHGGDFEPVTNAQTIWERKYSDLPPPQQAIKDMAFASAMRLAVFLAEDRNHTREQNYKLEERTKRLKAQLAKYEGKKTVVISKKRKRSFGLKIGEEGKVINDDDEKDKDFRPLHHRKVSSI